MVLTVCAAALGSRAENPHRRTCAPKEPPALASPGPPLSCCRVMWISTIWISMVVYACEHDCHTYLSLMCGRRCSEPAPHLASPASHVSVEHQCPAPGWGSGPGEMLWSHVISEVSESAAAHVYWASTGAHLPFTWPWQTGCPLPGNWADAWRLVLSSKALFIKALRGARTTTRHFIYMLYCYGNLKSIHTSWFLLFKSTLRDSRILTSCLIPCAS